MRPIPTSILLILAVCLQMHGDASKTEVLAMQGIAKRVEELIRGVSDGKIETKAMVPGKPAADGGYQMILIANKPLAAPAEDDSPAERDVRKA
jgi:hypothetical protein